MLIPAVWANDKVMTDRVLEVCKDHKMKWKSDWHFDGIPYFQVTVPLKMKLLSVTAFLEDLDAATKYESKSATEE